MIPCADHWARAVAALGSDYLGRFSSSLPKLETIDLLVDKWRFAKMCDLEAIPAPSTRLLKSLADLDGVPEDHLESAFLKPCDSHAFFLKYRVKAYRLADRDSGKRLLAEKLADGFAVLLQEYIPGPHTSHYFIDGFVRGDGSCAALFARRRLRMYPPDFGNSTYMVSVPIEEVREAADSLVRLWPRIGYRGIFSAEFKRDERDGVLKIIEINSRPWWYIGFATYCGVNVAEMAYREALGLPIETVDRYKAGRHAIFLYHDRQAYRLLHRRGEIGFWTWLRSCLVSHKMIYDWSDPLPAFSYFIQLLRGFLGRRVTR